MITLATALSMGAWRSSAVPQVPTKVVPTPPVPNKSLPTQQVATRVARSFSAQGIEAVYLRAETAERAEVRTIPGRRSITVWGVPEGDARGYHPSDPNWREIPAALWGLDFAGKQYGSALVISSIREIYYIHHYYHLSRIVIEVPAGVEVIRENRQLTGEPTPDLSAPARKRG
jgi:hypothetical protein